MELRARQLLSELEPSKRHAHSAEDAEAKARDDAERAVLVCKVRGPTCFSLWGHLVKALPLCVLAGGRPAVHSGGGPLQGLLPHPSVCGAVLQHLSQQSPHRADLSDRGRGAAHLFSLASRYHRAADLTAALAMCATSPCSQLLASSWCRRCTPPSTSCSSRSSVCTSCARYAPCMGGTTFAVHKLHKCIGCPEVHLCLRQALPLCLVGVQGAGGGDHASSVMMQIKLEKCRNEGSELGLMARKKQVRRNEFASSPRRFIHTLTAHVTMPLASA